MSKKFVIVNDVWNYPPFDDPDLYNETSSLVPFLSCAISRLRKHFFFDVIHCPKYTAEFYQKKRSRKRTKKLLEEAGYNPDLGYDEYFVKQDERIQINHEKDLITNTQDETALILNQFEINEVVVVGFHLGICIDGMIEDLVLKGNVETEKISLAANCTLPEREKYKNSYNDYTHDILFENLKNHGINIVHI